MSNAYSRAIIQAKSKVLAGTFRSAFASRPSTRSAAVASSSLVAIRGHFYPASNVPADDGVSTVTNVGRPAAAIYQGASGTGSVIISGGGSTTVIGDGSGGDAGDHIHSEYLTFVTAQNNFYTEAEIDDLFANVETHEPVTSPLETILVEFDEQEIEVNQDFNFAFGGNVVFDNVINAPGIIHDGDITISTTDGGKLNLFPSGDTVMNGIQVWEDWTGPDGEGVRIDWTGETPTYLDQLTVRELIAQSFTLHNAAVRNGELIVGPSASELTRPLVSPGDYGSAIAYVENIAGDWPVYLEGENVVYRYYCEASTVSLSARTGATDHVFAQRQSGGGATVLIDEDFESVTPPALPTDWTGTAKNNSMVTDNSLWEVSSGGDQKLQTNAPSGDDTNYHYHYTGTGYASLTNYEITGQILSTSNLPGRGITLFSDYPSTDTYIRIRRYGSNNYHVAVHGYENPDSGTTDSGFVDTPSVATSYRIWVQDTKDIAGTTTLRAKFWAGATEPANWQIDCYWFGPGRPAEGTVGFWGFQTATTDVYYSHIEVVALDEVTTISPVADTSVAVTADTSALLALVSQDTSSSMVATPGWTAVQAILGGPGTYDTVYKYTGTIPASGNVSTEWESSGDLLAVSVVAIESNLGVAVAFTSNYQSGSAWVDDEAALGDGYLELSIAALDGSDTSISTSDATQVLSESQHSSYRHMFSKLPLTNKPANVGYTLGESAVGGTIRVTYAPSISSAGQVAMGLAFGTVTSVTVGDEEDHEQAWTIDFGEDAPPAGCTVYPGTPLVGLGFAGQGFYQVSALDPLAGGPYDQFVIRGIDPSVWEVMLRSGYLGGLGAQGEVGFWFNYGGSTLELSDAGQYMTNINIYMQDESGEDFLTLDSESGINITIDPTPGNPSWDRGYTFEWPGGDELGGLLAHAFSVGPLDFHGLNLIVYGTDDSIPSIAVGTDSSFTGIRADSQFYAKSEDDHAEAKFYATQAGSGETSGITAIVTSAGVATMQMYGHAYANDVISYASGVVPSEPQDLARLADIYDTRDIIREVAKYQGDGTTEDKAILLARITFEAANYRACQIHLDIRTSKNNSIATDEIVAFASMGSTAAVAPEVFAQRRVTGTDALFNEVRLVHVSGTSTTAVFELYARYDLHYTLAYGEFRVMISSPNETEVEIFDAVVSDAMTYTPAGITSDVVLSY